MTAKTQQILKICVFLIFIGRAWQHLFWDAPYRSFFWNESFLKPIIEGFFNTPWQHYATSKRTDYYIQNAIKIKGIIYGMAALSALLLTSKTIKWLRFPILIGGVSLVLLSLLLTKEKFYHTAQFFEHSIQFGLPFVLLLSYNKKLSKERLIIILKIMIALTFFSHGLYAFGFYPVPGKFIDMVIHIFNCTESKAILFLYSAGIIDFVIAALIFIPKIEKYALWYAVIWGILTALARTIANFYWEFPLQSIHQNFYQTIFRLPHGLIPLLVIYIQKLQTINSKNKSRPNELKTMTTS
ncbi:hypothetical protein [Aquimarina pacifica]|uniref:hypothetical protein n=1 Tax=Aquimarina pacifica TaxID=1296415 RepID=UPI0005548B08|nr:hypothetical protein [Aquimarina pacifica]